MLEAFQVDLDGLLIFFLTLFFLLLRRGFCSCFLGLLFRLACFVFVLFLFFLGFLYIILGPILIIFASQVLLPNPSGDAEDLNDVYFGVSRPFFLFLAASQVWVNGVDLILKDGLTSEGGWNGVACVLALVLAFSRNLRVHWSVTGLILLLFAAKWIF